MNRTLSLASGLTIRLVALRQHDIYAGLLEGIPTREMNARIIANLVREARRQADHPPYLNEPTQTPIADCEHYRFGDPVQLPQIACIADFTSDGTGGGYITELTAVWFQSDYAFPFAPAIQTALVDLDWDACAKEVEL